MDDVDLHGWFERGELSTCPTCGQQGLIPVATGGSLCVECGSVHAAAKTTDATAEEPETPGP